MRLFSIHKFGLSIAVCAISGAALAAEVGKADITFVTSAAAAGMQEMQASALAEKTAQAPQVKSFAKKMLDDHGKADADLKALAEAKNIQLPASMNKKQQAQLAELGKLKGAEFDKKYAQEIGVMAHEEAVALFTNASKNAADPDIKAFASKTLPVLQGHLQMAKEMHAGLHKAE
jgi:putative membrane protein